MITKPRRYQLNKDALAIVHRDQPWIFRDHLSSAALTFADGQWLRLYDGNNRVVGFGMYQVRGAIAIRVIKRGDVAPTAAWIGDTVARAAVRREPLKTVSNAIRWISGESDGLPAVVVEQVADVIVAQSYSRGADVLTRIAAHQVMKMCSARRMMWRPARRRLDQASAPALQLAPDLVDIQECGIPFVVDVGSGQKTGSYLDLRGLRTLIANRDLTGKRVLNLFSYTAMLGRCAERAGATDIVNVDASNAALAFGEKYHCDDRSKQTFVCADVFDWLFQHHERYDVVIVDPPTMTSRREQSKSALATYRRIYQHARDLVAPGGMLVAACCTGRITRSEFTACVTDALGRGWRLAQTVPAQIDHPVAFEQADYLKILVFAHI
jgi:23S rRNA (cytosine1962-C5)-methyltransferase